jgi:hypothetical protein
VAKARRGTKPQQRTLRLCLVARRDDWCAGSVATGRMAVIFCPSDEGCSGALAGAGTTSDLGDEIAGTHATAGLKMVQAVAVESGEPLHRVWILSYDPDTNRIERLRRVTQRVDSFNHRRRDLAALVAAAAAHFRLLAAR